MQTLKTRMTINQYKTICKAKEKKASSKLHKKQVMAVLYNCSRFKRSKGGAGVCCLLRKTPIWQDHFQAPVLSGLGSKFKH